MPFVDVVGVFHLGRGQDGHGAGLLGDDDHLDHAVLQHLVGADGLTELLARFQVFQRGVGHFRRIDDGGSILTGMRGKDLAVLGPSRR